MGDRRMTKRYLDMAARAGLRGLGDVEPNPMVGAVIVKKGKGGEEQVIGIGHHRRFGGLHAEREALRNARENGFDVKGSAVYCTLEPCCHVGKQPACCEALIEAGVAGVVYARRDPAEVSRGGHEILVEAGIRVRCDDCSELACSISDSFIYGVKTGLPWVVAKWAQTIDGKIATLAGESQWISNERSRAAVHRMRARVDAIGVGMGTVLADDPMLTARGVRRVRRTATRVVFDTQGRLLGESKLAQTAGVYPTVVCTGMSGMVGGAVAGVRVLECPVIDGKLDLRTAMELLRSEFGISNMLIEAGPTLLGGLFEADLICEAVVHVGASIMGDGKGCVEGRGCPSLDQMKRMKLRRVRRVGDDVHLWYGRG